MSIFFTSDNHFYHKNIIEYERRPYKDVEEMNERMIENWNKKVKNNDDVYILGDFSFGNGNETNSLLESLNGRKYIVRGNHDYFLDKKDFNMDLIEWAKDYYVLKYNKMKFVLFHFPIAVWDCKHHGSIHLYGHVHSNTTTDHPLRFELFNSYNVGVDVNDYMPVSIEKVLARLI